MVNDVIRHCILNLTPDDSSRFLLHLLSTIMYIERINLWHSEGASLASHPGEAGGQVVMACGDATLAPFRSSFT